MSGPKQVRPELEALEDRMVPATIELTTAGASGSAAGALFEQSSPQPTGSGVIHSFVRLHAGGNGALEQGYNTDARPLQYDENNSPTFTRSIQLTDAPIVVIHGVAYREFLLDINQKSSSPQVSLDELRIYVGNAPNLIDYDPCTNQLAGLNPVFDLGSNNVILDARLSHGSGSGDMFLYVPDALLTQAGGNYVYLYSKFGATIPTNGGFEEWAVRDATTALSSLSGFVYNDIDNNHVFDSGNQGLSDVLVTLSGTTNQGQSVLVQTWSNSSGFYLFSGLVPGIYNLTESVPFNSALDSTNLGSLGGTPNSSFNQFTGINVGTDIVGRDYNFGNTVSVFGGS
jgi:hypothetical protein